MVDVLSQNEIDALLAALSSGEMSAEELKKEESQKKIRNYNFKRATRFSKDHLRSLTRVHENFARYLTTYFSTQLRTFVQINVVHVDQLPYDEFINSIPKMTILNVFEAAPLEGRMVLEVHPSVAFAMLDRLLGGAGVSPSQINSLTEIETTIIERIFGRALRSLKESWQTVIDIEPELEALETNPQFMQLASANDTIALISLSTKIGETTGMMNICIPHVVIEPIMPSLSVHHMFVTQKKQHSEEDQRALELGLSRASLPVISELGSTHITVQDMMALSQGDVIKLDQTLERLLTVKVGEQNKFYGRPGTVKGKNAVQITEVVQKGDDLDAE